MFGVVDSKIPNDGLTIQYSMTKETTSFALDGSIAVGTDFIRMSRDRITILHPTGSWPSDAEEAIPMQITVEVGMEAGTAPDEFETTALFLVRGMLEGSLYEKIPEGMTQLLLKEHYRPTWDVLDINLIERGIHS